MQVTEQEQRETHARARQDAEAAYNLSHANVVNTLSHELTRIGNEAATGELAMFKLYMVQARTPASHMSYCAAFIASNAACHTLAGCSAPSEKRKARYAWRCPQRLCA